MDEGVNVSLSSYPRHLGCVVIGKYDLSAKCEACHKSIAYTAGLNLAAWKEMLRQFVKQHRQCTDPSQTKKGE